MYTKDTHNSYRHPHCTLKQSQPVPQVWTGGGRKKRGRRKKKVHLLQASLRACLACISFVKLRDTLISPKWPTSKEVDKRLTLLIPGEEAFFFPPME
jgi:hypothetical protein